MENQETPEQKRIKELELELFNSKSEIDRLIFINTSLGYSTTLMSEFHMSHDDKIILGEYFDSAKNTVEIKEMYDKFRKEFHNKALDDESADLQWSPGFKEKIRHYFAVSLGYDIVSEIGDNLSLIASYFTLENKIRNTPDAALRQPMTDKLLGDREAMLIAMDNIINIINSFNEKS